MVARTEEDGKRAKLSSTSYVGYHYMAQIHKWWQSCEVFDRHAQAGPSLFPRAALLVVAFKRFVPAKSSAEPGHHLRATPQPRRLAIASYRWTRRVSHFASVTLAGSLALLASSCKLEEAQLPFSATPSDASTNGASPAINNASTSGVSTTLNGVSTPTIASPLPGASFADTQPSLTVTNASAVDGATLTYEFQVATDDGFTTVVAQVGRYQAGGGLTSWQVTPPLSGGTYFWRARAVGPSGPGPYTPISDFTIRSGSDPAPAPSPSPSPSPAPNPGVGEIFDPLTNGSSVGQQAGGRFRSQGWQVTARGDYIRYVVPTLANGFVEWENLGLTPRNPQRDLYTLMGMWDPSRGAYRDNPFRVHVRKLDDQGHNPPYIRLRFIANGDQHDPGGDFDFREWDPGRAYRWRLEWGSTGSGNAARLFLDGRQIARTSYGPTYNPRQHWIEMGVEERAESIVGVIYRNVRIGRQ